MRMSIETQAADILAFWFGELDGNGWDSDARQPLWFGARPEDDETMRARYGGLIAAAIAGRLDSWEAHSDAANMALILLADQMTRAVHRGSAQAFGGDAVALRVCKNGVADGRHLRLPAAWRRFYYLPLEHSESLADQKQCVQLFQQLQQDFPQYSESLAASAKYAEIHRDLIEKFGRFPHRNAALGRSNTAAEERHLADSKQNFGQKRAT